MPGKGDPDGNRCQVKVAHGIREKVGLQQIVKRNAPKASGPIKRDVRDKRDSGWQTRFWDVAPYEKVEEADKSNEDVEMGSGGHGYSVEKLAM